MFHQQASASKHYISAARSPKFGLGAGGLVACSIAEMVDAGGATEAM
jgi:hypothetical protein